jgi:hypothetical protein
MTRLLDIGNAISAIVGVVFWFLSAKIPHRRRRLTLIKGRKSH